MTRSSAFAWLAVGALAFIGCGGDDSGGGAADSSVGGGASTGAGGAGTGGSTGNGGSAAGTGGSTGAGGASTGSGGATGSGGSAGTGGARLDAGTGGATGTGGAAGTGGSTGAGGGAAGTGGARLDAGSDARAGGGTDGGAASPMMNFFVTSDTSATGNLGGLQGADARCQSLAAAAGQGNKTWRAYLSADTPATNARDRIGEGPYYNSQGAVLAATKDALHARTGDPALFIDEHGTRINGQWTNSPGPLQHDILTGSTGTGMLNANLTCGSWMNGTTGSSEVGHADGLGPGMATTGTLTSWNAAHTGQCNNTTPGGGAGRLYCFVGP
jgi:hypothetical protein